MPELVEQIDGKLRLNFHAGQYQAWQSEKRFDVVLAGTQGGKTAFGPLWLYREIQRRGPGDYLIVTPNFTLMEKKALPEFKRYFEDRLQLGSYVGSPARKFTFSEDGAQRTFGKVADTPTCVYFGYAADPDSLESATAKAAWLDEAGQKKFKLSSWEAIQRRLAIHQGRVLVTTTPYDLGWLKQKFYDPWKKANGNHPEIDLIRFDSTENPAFPKEEFERAKRELPRWKFDLFYRAIFTRPAGLIYDAFDADIHVCPRFKIPDHWPRYLGLDFGGVHTCGVFFAEEPATRRLFAYREYLCGGRTAREHAQALLRNAGEEPRLPTLCVGGSKSEGQWRDEFRAGGLPVQEPKFSDVEVGIDRVYATQRRGEFVVFSDLTGLLEELATYSRVVDDAGEPTEEIDDKHSYHHLDAVRYIIGRVRAPSSIAGPVVFGRAPRGQGNVIERLPDGVLGKRRAA